MLKDLDINNLYANTQNIILALQAILHTLCALAIAKDIANLNKKYRNTIILPNIGWILSAFIGGLFAVFVYWIIHHSTLQKNNVTCGKS